MTITLAKTDQAITFNALGGRTYGDVPFAVSATADSELSVSFSSQTSSVCTVSASTVTIVTAGTCTIRASQAGDDTYNAAPNVDRTFIVVQKTLSVSIGTLAASTKVYDRTTDAAIVGSPAGLNGVVGEDDVTLAGTVAGTFDTKNVGNSKTVTVGGFTLDGAKASNYTLTQPTFTANITAKHITGSFTASNKTYDGNNTATVTSRSPVSVISGDTVSLTGGTATFSDETVANNKVVTLVKAVLIKFNHLVRVQIFWLSGLTDW